MALSGTDDLTSRGNGSFSVGSRLLGLSHSYQSPRFGRWQVLGAGTLLQEGERDYAFEAESKAEHFTNARFNWSLRMARRWSRDWLIWREGNLLASYHRTQMLLACDVNWLPATNHELRLKLQWLGMKAYDPTPMRIDLSGQLIESYDQVSPFSINNLGIQLRYRWSFGDQSDLYLVYGRGGISLQEGNDAAELQRLFESSASLRDNDAVLVKVRYSLPLNK